MKKIIFLLLIILFQMLQSGASSAQTFTTFLNAGSSTIQAGLDAEYALDEGYLRTGLSGLYTNYHRGENKSLEAHVAIGNDFLIEGLKGELGIKGLIGSVDKGSRNSDLGSLAFMAGGIYQLPKDIFPVTTKVFTEITWTPGPLAFIDMDRYFDIKAGVDVFLIERAALEFSYLHYDMKIKGTSGDWNDKNDIVMLGVKLRF
jgi:hypothetical protein